MNYALAPAPMMWQGRGLGAINVARFDMRAFTDKECGLLETFANQAVIAIQNARLFNETREALEQQTATASVLRVMSDSPTDVQPVFDAIVQSCQRLFGGKAVALAMPVGSMMESVAFASDGIDQGSGGFLKPWPFDRGSGAGTCILESRVVAVADTMEGARQFFRMKDLALALGYHSALFVPLLRDGKAIGCLTILRAATGKFEDKEISLAQTFADQAVIAIENVRLFNETKDALERQKASAEVLQVISGSMADARPVFQKILQSCQRIFASDELVTMLVGDDGQLHLGAGLGPVSGNRDPSYVRPYGGSATEVAIQARRVLHFADTLAAAEMPDSLRQMCQHAGIRSLLLAPMLWDERGVGSIVVGRTQSKPYSDKDIALLKTFADQAVIAIHNVRLFNETKEALEQQTATSEVLKVISSSVADTAPVFDKILESGLHLFATEQMGVFLVGDDGQLHVAAWRGEALGAIARTFPKPLAQTITARVLAERQAVHVPDAAAMADAPASIRGVVELIGNVSAVWAPMLWEDKGIGSLCVLRQPPKPFTDKELSLLKTFADQAVIAIQNARLFNETKEALEQQRTSGEVLKVISNSVADPAPVFEAIGKACQQLFSGDQVVISLVGADGQVRHASIATPHGVDAQTLDHTVTLLNRGFPRPLEKAYQSYPIRKRRVIHYPDDDEALRAITLYPAQILGVADRLGSLAAGRMASFIVTDGDPPHLGLRARAPPCPPARGQALQAA